MRWPQWFVLIAMVLSLVYLAAKAVRDRSNSSGTATAIVFGMIVWEAINAGVLHVGGFW